MKDFINEYFDTIVELLLGIVFINCFLDILNGLLFL